MKSFRRHLTFTVLLIFAILLVQPWGGSVMAASPLNSLTATQVGDDSVTLSWTAPLSPDSVELQVKPDGGEYARATYDATDEEMKTAGFVTANGLTMGTQYSFKLVVSGGNNAGDSNEVTATPGFAGGKGDAEHPYIITTAEHLDNARNFIVLGSSSCFRMDDDIDLAAYGNWQPFVYLSSNQVFDGNNHIITNLTVTGGDETGLFKQSWGTIRSLSIQDADVQGDDNTAILVGFNLRGRILDCQVSGRVTGATQVGGLAGYHGAPATMQRCISTAEVTGNLVVGGLAGYFIGGEISDCYSSGSVTGNNCIGGLIGLISSGATISNSYAVGGISASGASHGGLVGVNITEYWVNNSFFDRETTGEVSSVGGEPKTTVEMKTRDTFVDWDFTNIWAIVEGQTYPLLRNFEPFIGPAEVALSIPEWEEESLSVSGTVYTQYNIGIDTISATSDKGLPADNGDGTWTWTWNLTSDDWPLPESIVVTAVDEYVYSNNSIIYLNVTNIQPSVGDLSLSSSTVDSGTSITADVEFTDPGRLDTHTAVIDWGDGNSVSADVTEANGSGSASGSHSYDSAGTYQITLTVTDSDGGTGVSYGTVTVTQTETGSSGGGGSSTRVPAVLTTGVDFLGNSVTLKGKVISHGFCPVTEYGFLYGTAVNSLTEKLAAGTDNYRGEFTAALENISARTTYYYQAYAINQKGTAKGEVKGFFLEGNVVFNDLGPGHWAYQAIMSLFNQGYVRGYTDGSIKSDNNITRGEFTAMLVRILELPEYTPQTPSFGDVAPGSWYYTFIEAAARAGLVYGQGDGNFAPDKTITREEAVAILVRALDLEEEAMLLSSLPGFTDDDSISGWARGLVNIAHKQGLVDGYPDGSFQPHNLLTRAEAFVMMRNFIAELK